MKKIFLVVLALVFTSHLVAQNQASFPYKLKLKDVNGNKVSTKTFSKYKDGLVLVFVEPKKIYHLGSGNAPGFMSNNPHPSYSFLTTVDELVEKWKNKYNVKTIVIFHSDKIADKKITEIVKENNWKFDHYFNKSRRLYKKITKNNLMNLESVSIFNENFENTFNSDFKSKYNKFFCKTKDGSWKEYCKINNKVVKQTSLSKETEEALELLSIQKQNRQWQEQSTK